MIIVTKFFRPGTSVLLQRSNEVSQMELAVNEVKPQKERLEK